MADRKQTPDVLGELLGSPGPGEMVTPAPTPREAPVESSEAGRKQPRRRTRTSSRKEKWGYLLVSCQEYRGWRPRYVNGQELEDWMNAPAIHDYVNQLGEEGWELTSASGGQSLYGLTDRHQLYFKRPKR